MQITDVSRENCEKLREIVKNEISDFTRKV